MPFYDYNCSECGPFTSVRTMEKSAEPCTCPDCGQDAPRAFLTMPFVAGMDAARRNAFATNERSAHDPKRSSQTGHGPGCSCCSSGKKNRKTLTRPDGSKSFPTARPWQISH
ncbi:zinc ribbon domain-containing protein [Notoacmeibacter sp. MSK16QG-6]|uniref:zinc ribbon domain-containing protein n=1 Tax=Notoacmeibacter sp. MSK16QG-6 TaxID=2957982 RepID=UPI00209F5B4C|nr:zinc ribbon domain-containing protein [Notoacmeibacter sp. MSK16QG-6]MCP1200833.1 zinc ribbon domain-containing protein [Notoacmeibacter sp. MSK16QG-6]